MKIRKKPVAINAFQWKGDTNEVVVTFWRTVGGTHAYYWNTSVEDWRDASMFYIDHIGTNRIKPIEEVK